MQKRPNRFETKQYEEIKLVTRAIIYTQCNSENRYKNRPRNSNLKSGDLKITHRSQQSSKSPKLHKQKSIEKDPRSGDSSTQRSYFMM